MSRESISVESDESSGEDDPGGRSDGSADAGASAEPSSAGTPAESAGDAASDASSEAASPAELTTEAATAGILRVLGRLYLEPPTEDQLERLAAWADGWLADAEGDDDIAAPLRQLREAGDADIEHLRKEFTRLFRGVSHSHSPEPPYESVYRDGQLYSSIATEVQHGYRSAGLAVSEEDGNEPPDHLGLELQFLATLCEYATQPKAGQLPPSRARDAQEWFLDEHLLTWIEGFRGRVLQADPPAFYRAVLDLTVETVRAHRVALHEREEGSGEGGSEEGDDDAR